MVAELRKGDVTADFDIADEIEVEEEGYFGEAVLAVLEEKDAQSRGGGCDRERVSYLNFWVIWSYTISYKTKGYRQLFVHVHDRMAYLGHNPGGSIEARRT